MTDLRQVLLTRLEASWQTIDFTVADLTHDELHHHAEGAQIGTPASIYLHVAWVEDLVINQMLQGKETVYVTQGWAEKMPDAPVHQGKSTFDWAWSVTVPAAATLTAYADAVRETVREYIGGLSDEDFSRIIPSFLGETPQADLLTYLIWDLANHTGEIAALRGVSGKIGLPF